MSLQGVCPIWGVVGTADVYGEDKRSFILVLNLPCVICLSAKSLALSRTFVSLMVGGSFRTAKPSRLSCMRVAGVEFMT